jgi:uncharacterized protein
MSQDNVEIVRAIYGALNRGDWDAVFCNAHPDFELTLLRGLDEGTHQGRRKVQRILEDQRTAFDAWIVEPEQLIENGDQVVVIVMSRVRPKGTSAQLELRNGHIWTIREGVIMSMRGFPDPKEALEAAGITNRRGVSQ